MVDDHPEWKAIIDNYFNALKEGYTKFVTSLPDQAPLTEKEKGLAEARQHALAAALHQVDLDLLEAEWTDWIRKLKNPWEGKRR